MKEADAASAETPDRATRRWRVGPRGALTLLLLCYAVNFADRTIVNVVGEAIKEDLRLSDAQLGLLGGLSFALFYATMSIPIARLAERTSRVNIIAASVAFWSAMTALCATAQTYTHLLLMRMGVGVGEAGLSPAAQSLIADYFPPDKRATAVSIYYIGVPLGVVGGAVAAGLIAEAYGWRNAFLVLGLPGLLLAFLVRFLMPEPRRGALDAADASDGSTPPLKAVIAQLARNPILRHVIIANTLAGFAGYAIGQFLHPLFVRQFAMSYADAAFLYGALAALSAGIGSPLGGVIADRAARRDARWLAWIPAFGMIAAGPFYYLAVFQDHWLLAAVFLFVPGLLNNLSNGPTFALIHNDVSARMRATAIAIVIFMSAMIGAGLGPLLAGAASDLFAHAFFEGPISFSEACPGGRAPKGVEAQAASACLAASGAGVQSALALVGLTFVWAGAHFLIAARHMKTRASAQENAPDSLNQR